MVDDLDQGRRPIRIGPGAGAARALAACPGVHLEHPSRRPSDAVDRELFAEWGPVRRIWEGYAPDPGLRFRASSGGLVTALSTFALQRGFAGVLHVGPDESEPWKNRTVLSQTKEEVESRCGSRYSPSSPGEGLGLIEAADGPCVLVAKPCDVAGAQQARALRPALDANLALTIGIFCAGTPSLRGTLAMLQVMGIDDPRTVTAVRYRGHGWPGRARADAIDTDGSARSAELSYEESWGDILQKHRQWRCMICPDHTGEFADISVGDPWYRPTGDDPGQSLVVARTEAGERFVLDAIASGAITVVESAHRHLPASQPNLATTRGQVWGRLIGMRLMNMPVPRYRNVPMFPSWWRRLSPREKLGSVAGTMRRVWQRKLYRRRPVQPRSPSG